MEILLIYNVYHSNGQLILLENGRRTYQAIPLRQGSCSRTAERSKAALSIGPLCPLPSWDLCADLACEDKCIAVEGKPLGLPSRVSQHRVAQVSHFVWPWNVGVEVLPDYLLRISNVTDYYLCADCLTCFESEELDNESSELVKMMTPQTGLLRPYTVAVFYLSACWYICYISLPKRARRT